METIIDSLKRKLRAAGSGRWEAISSEAGVAKTLPRKIAFNDRENPGVQTIQPLVDYFKEVESGARSLPEISAPARASNAQAAIKAGA